MARRKDLLQGTLDLLILRTLAREPLHGWAISKRIRARSDDVFRIQQGSLYPALYRLEDRRWIRGSWGISPEGRRARFYTLTAKGRRRLAEEHADWRVFRVAMEAVLDSS